MTDTYIAQGMIRWGPKDKAAEDGKSALVIFHDGDVVTGPDKDEMQELIDAGAVVKKSDLERREAPGEPSDMEKEHAKALEDRDKEIERLRARVQELEAKQGTQADAGSTAKPAATK